MSQVKFWKTALMSLLSGVVLSFTLPPFFLIALMPAVWTFLLMLVIQQHRFRHAWFVGYLFGLGYFVPSLYWINIGILLDPNFYWLIPIAFLALPAYLSIYVAFPFALAWKLRFRSPYVLILSFASFLTIGEAFRGFMFTGFPWNTFGLPLLASLPMSQAASVLGVYGLTFIGLVFSASFFLLQSYRKYWKGFSFIVVLACVLWGWGSWRLACNPTRLTDTHITLVQPSFIQKAHLSREENFNNIKKLVELSDFSSLQHYPRIVIWPESAVNFTYNKIPQLGEWIQHQMGPHDILLFGTTRVEGEDKHIRALNSLLALSAEKGLVFDYDKHHLLPFGEFVPLEDFVNKFFNIKAITGGAVSFSPGSGPQTFKLPDGMPSVSPSICYEAVFSGDQALKKPRPAWLVNITNDAWFGDSIGPYQHFQMARLRAIEEGVPMVRVAVSGISAVIDPMGRIVEKIPLNVRKALTTQLPEPLEKKTLFAKHRHQLLILLVGFLWLFVLVRGRVKR